MAIGEKTFSTGGRQVKTFDKSPLPAGDYDFKIRATEGSVGKRPEPGKLPYVQVPLEALGTSATEGGKNRVLYHTFFTSLQPGKDGTVMTDRGDQLVGLARAMGEEATNLPILTLNNEEGNSVDCVDARALLAWIKNHDGQIVRAHTSVKKDKTGEYARIAYFIVGEDSSGSSMSDAWSRNGQKAVTV